MNEYFKKGNENQSPLEIKKYPDSVLRNISKPVENLDEGVLWLIENMAKSMYINQGIGLAAPQVGYNRQVITFDVGKGLVSLINPHIVESEGEKYNQEGCLSLPEISVEVKRKSKVLVKGLDIKGKETVIEASDPLSRVIQHEIDHLNGILLIDKTSLLKKQFLINKLKKIKKRSVRQ